MLYMEDYEIEYSYRNASKKNCQIEILADLNAATVPDICDVLYRRGVLETFRGHGARYMVARLLHEKKPDSQIKRELKISQSQIDKVRKNYGCYRYLFGNEIKTQMKPFNGIYKENKALFEKMEVLRK